MLYVGLDYHTKHSYVSILTDNGNEIMEGRVESTSELPDLLGNLPEEAKVIFEAGYGWPRLVKILEGIPVELVMCNPVENRKIACDRRKSDRRDAKNLAVYLLTETYKDVYIPDEEVRAERQLIRGRTHLSRNMTMTKNRVHGLLSYAGVPKECGDIFTKKRRDFLESVELPEDVRKVLDTDIRLLDLQSDLINDLDKRIAEMNRSDPDARLLKTIPGVGDFTARMIIAQVGDIKRFATDKSIACYCGLTPGQRQSSDKLRMMGISKEGSAMLRWCLVQSSWTAIRLDPGLREFFEKLSSKKDSCTAICAVARKLAVIVFHIMTKKVPYRPVKAASEGKPVVPFGKSAKCA
jgi:transposase